MSCISGLTKSKYVLFGLNVLLVVGALCLIVFGTKVILNDREVKDSSILPFIIGRLAIVIGVIIGFAILLGSCGAIRDNSCMLSIYAVILMCLCILQILLSGLTIFELQKDNDVYKYYETRTYTLFEQSKNNTELVKDVDRLQNEWKCCGVNGPDRQMLLPNSCCPQAPCTIDTAYQKGCSDAQKDDFTLNMTVISAISLVFAVIELVGITLACIVRKRHSQYTPRRI